MLSEKSGYIIPISKLIKFWKTFQTFIGGGSVPQFLISIHKVNQKEDVSSSVAK